MDTMYNVYIHIHIYIHTHIHIYIHTYTYTYTYIHPQIHIKKYIYALPYIFLKKEPKGETYICIISPPCDQCKRSSKNISYPDATVTKGRCKRTFSCLWLQLHAQYIYDVSGIKIIQVTMYTIWELIQPPAHAPVLQPICESEQKINHIFHYFVYKYIK